jgi:hypothetical protein
MITKVYMFDFDGTLFNSPRKPTWWQFKGWWSNPNSLSFPCIPKNPGNEWWNPSVVAAAKKAISDPQGTTVLCTGRIKHRFTEIVTSLVKDKGLKFDRLHFNPGDDTLPYKIGVIKRLKEDYPFATEIAIYDDRHNHLEKMADFAKEIGFDVVNPHPIRENSQEVSCTEDEYLQLQGT